jgi:predicted porin
MKKTVLAMAVVGALPFAASAQNVSVYGRIDTGVQSYSQTTAAGVNASATRPGNSLWTTNRFGIMGSEDLGGGLKAEFMLESGLTFSNGLAGRNTLTSSSSLAITITAIVTNSTVAAGSLSISQSYSTSQDTFMFDREAWVGISGSFGRVQLGRVNGMQTNVDSLVSQAGNFGLVGRVGTTNTDALTDKMGNSVLYTSPTFNGLSVQVGQQFMATNTNVTMTTADGTKTTTYAANYSSGPLKLGIGIADKQGAFEEQTNIGVSYDFGIASVGLTRALYERSATAEDQVTILSVQVPLGSGLFINGALHDANTKGTNASGGKGAALVVRKELSKRTQVHASYVQVNNDAAGTYTFSAANSSTTAGLDQKAVSVGLSHLF